MDEPDSNGEINCLPAKVVLDMLILLVYHLLAIFRAFTCYQENHTSWSYTIYFIILLPGLSIVIGMLLDRPAISKRVIGKYIVILLAPTFWILWLAYKTIFRNERKLQMMIHTWSFKGLIEIPFLFLLQLKIFFQRTPVGNYVSLPNGRFGLHILEISVSFLTFLYTIGKYHNLLDNDFRFRSVVKVFPYFAINIIFRTFTMTVIILYMNYLSKPSIGVIIFILIITNIITTYKWSLNFTAVRPHKIFSSFIGGIISILTPAFGCFFGETSSGKCLRSYYRINTFIINTTLGIIFFIISLVLLFDKENNSILLNQFPLAGCHPSNYNYTKTGIEFGFNDPEKPIIVDNFQFLGSPWTVRLGNKHENFSILSYLGIQTEQKDKPVYLVAQLCHGDFTFFYYFAVVVPVVVVLFVLSTLSAVYIDHMGINFNQESIEHLDYE